MHKVLVFIVALGVIGAGCSFSQYSQTVKLDENIDTYRTGCEVNADVLLAEYKQYEANQYYTPGYGPTPRPTPVPKPVSDSDLTIKAMLEKVWENGCLTGRRDTVGAEQVEIMALRDQLTILDGRIAAMEQKQAAKLAAVN